MHEKEIEIRWRDLDPYGHVNHAVSLHESAPGAPEADDAEARAANAAQLAGGLPVPAAAAHLAVEHDDAAQEREDERQRMVGDLLDAVVRDAADPDAAALGLLNVHVVEADAAGRDDAECREPFELGRSDGLVRADEEPDHVVTFPRRGSLHDLGEVADDRRDFLERVVGVADQNSHASPSP